MKECIVILGMHRSGTSVLAGLVSIMGAYAGSHLMDPSEDNPRGYFENNKVVELNEKILEENNSSWDDYYFSLKNISVQKKDEYLKLAKDIIQDELKYAKTIIIKDPRMCVLFPIWEGALNELGINIKTIFVYRSPMEVALSLQARDKMPIEKGLMLWSHYLFLSEKYSRGYKRFIVHYSDDFYNIESFLKKLSGFTGHTLTNPKLVTAKEFYSPKLKHQNISFENISTELPSYLNGLIELLVERNFDSEEKLDGYYQEFQQSKDFYLWNERILEKQLQEQGIHKNKLEEELSILTNKSNEQLEQLQQTSVTLKKTEERFKETEERLKETEERLKETEENFANEKRDFELKLDEMLAPLEEKKEELTAEKLRTQQLSETLIKKETLESGLEKLNVSLKKEEVRSQAEKQELADKTQELQKLLEEKDKRILFLEHMSVTSETIFNNVINSKKSIQTIKENLTIPFFSKFKLKLSPLISKKAKKELIERNLIVESGLFSPLYYLANYPDVYQKGQDPLTHFCDFGWKEGRNPSLDFNCIAYLNAYDDVKGSNKNPLLHYVRYGKKENRQAFPVFLKKNDVKIIEKRPKKKCRKLIPSKIVEINWESSLTAISILNKKKKLVSTQIPEELLSFSKKQLAVVAPTVSVVMPTWNRVRNICEAVDSIFTQSYQPIQVIVVDDGSTDGTIELLYKTYAKQLNDGLLVIIENKHKGVSTARNAGLAEATGDLVAYLDSDNMWREHYLLIMAAAFSENDELSCAYAALERHNKNVKGKNEFLCSPYQRKQLLDENFIDLNVFVHRRLLYQQFGGFDVSLKRFVDWELIIRYTKNYAPALIPFVGVDYFLDDRNLKNITTTVSLDDNRQRVYDSHFFERVNYGLEKLRIAYVLWDFPALSQTFVLSEIKWLVDNNYDVIVYYSIKPEKSAMIDFEVEAHQVNDADELSQLLSKHQRNLCHSHFAYPTVTLLTYPACLKANIYFTFMPHAVDIFHYDNIGRNKIDEITRHPLCLKVFVHGEFHKKFIEDCGVPSEKIVFNIQAVNLADFANNENLVSLQQEGKKVFKGVVISRFVEKKGINTLMDAAVLLKNENVVFDIYGYGPLEEDYKKQIKELNLTNIFLKGALTNQQEVLKAYEGCDFLIAPGVVAKSGDMDGFPTVIFEAMAVGLPVITTDIAAIPDYLTDGVEALIAKAGSVDQIAERVRRLITMSEARKIAMVKRAQSFLDKKVGVDHTMQMLLDIWQDYTLDIFLVTFNTEKYDDKKETFEIINRIFKYTTTPFTLTIIDNNSNEDFWSELCNMVIGYPNVRLIRKYDNQYCGPASNIALELSSSEYAIYICSKEGFIKSHGWERTLLDHMRNNPNDAIAGHLSQMPSYIYGKEYVNYPEFSKFRNPDYARENPDRVFKHVQGGVYIINKQFITKHGGFNPAIPHGGMDIEISYYMESLGYSLGEIPEVASLTVKTLPKLAAILNERTVVAHPLTLESVGKELDSLDKAKTQRCNVCGWGGDVFISENRDGKLKQKCPECESTGFSRSVLNILANNHHIYRNETCVILSDDLSIGKSLKAFFKPVSVLKNEDLFLSALKKTAFQIDCIIVDPELMNESSIHVDAWKIILERLSPLGEVIFADALFLDISVIEDASASNNKHLRKALSYTKNHYSIQYEDISSYCIGYEWRRFGRMTRSLKRVNADYQ